MQTPEPMLDFVMRKHDVYYHRKREELSAKSGVPRHTLNKVLQGRTKQPLASTVQRIYDVLVAAERSAKRKVHKSGSNMADFLAQEAAKRLGNAGQAVCDAP
ncbi:hypothetical protein [Cupriavidus basilensis]|uniref:hypothetical protein n=1 Tax=Cupriavidus basilensis TaxID=68895 RepID=UPI001184EBD5|nr:hypothetical protein [Cupriavidus basilensis]